MRVCIFHIHASGYSLVKVILPFFVVLNPQGYYTVFQPWDQLVCKRNPTIQKIISNPLRASKYDRVHQGA